MKKAFTAKRYTTREKLFNSLDYFACNDKEFVIQRAKPEESQVQEILRYTQDDGRFSLAPMREREELLCEQSELSNSGEGCKELPSPVAFATQSPKCRKTRHFDKILKQVQHENFSCAEHTVKDFSPLTSHFPQLCTPHPSPLPQGAREELSCAEHTLKNLFSHSPIHLFTFKKVAFTLAEVLITLGIIGVVAALTLPTLVKNYQKHVYYNQFRKAASSLENALRQYSDDIGCTDSPLCGAWWWDDGTKDFAKDFSKYFKVATLLTKDNYEEVCKNYKKVAYNYDGSYVNYGSGDNGNSSYICGDNLGNPNAYVYGFITLDGMLFSFYQDEGAYGFGSLIDTNGPDNGPNTYGRDMFVFYLTDDKRKELCGNMWGMNRACYERQDQDSIALHCYNDKLGSNCAARLIEEGKMNY